MLSSLASTKCFGKFGEFLFLKPMGFRKCLGKFGGFLFLCLFALFVCLFARFHILGLFLLFWDIYMEFGNRKKLGN